MNDRNDLSERSPRKAVDDTEMVPEDDAVIGRAFRWSLAVLVVFGVAAGSRGRSAERGLHGHHQ